MPETEIKPYWVIGYHYDDGITVVHVSAASPQQAAEKAQFRGKTIVFHEEDGIEFANRYVEVG